MAGVSKTHRPRVLQKSWPHKSRSNSAKSVLRTVVNSAAICYRDLQLEVLRGARLPKTYPHVEVFSAVVQYVSGFKIRLVEMEVEVRTERNIKYPELTLNKSLRKRRSRL